MTFEIQVVKFARHSPVDLLEPGENNLDLNLDELTGSAIRDSELQSDFVAIRSDNRIAAIDNSG